ncbi:MAG: hypothetical protein ACT4OM_07795 [Actinomycetota bacterium]
MKLEQQVGRILTKATNAAADVVIARAQMGRTHDESEALEMLKIKMSAIEQAVLLLAGKLDALTGPDEDIQAPSPIGS